MVPARRRRGTAGPSRAAPARRRSARRCPGGRRRGTRPRSTPARPPAVALDRGLEPGPRRGVDAVADLGEQLVELPPRERRRTRGSGYPAARRRGEVVHDARTIAPDRPASPARRRRRRAAPTPSPTRSPSTNGVGRAPGAGTRTPAAAQHVGQLDRRRRRGRRPADPQHDVAGDEDRRSSRRAAAPAAAGPSARPPRRRRRRPRADRADRRRTGAAQAIEQVDAGVEPAGRVEALLDPPVQLDDRRVDAPRRRRLGVVDDADADLGDERARSASRDLAGRRSTSARRSAAAAGRRARRRASTAACGVDVALVALEQHPRRRAVPQHRRRPVQRGPSTSDGSTAPANHCSQRGARPRAQDHVAEEPERAARPDEQPAQVEPADVLHRRPAGLDDLAGRRHVARLQHGVAHRAVAEPADPAAADGERAADRAARRERDALAVRRRAPSSSSATERARRRTTPSSPPAGSSRSPPARDTARTPGDRPAAGAEPGDRDRVRRCRPRRRTPSDPRALGDRRGDLEVAAAGRAGQHLARVGQPARVERRRAARPGRRGRRPRTSAASGRASRARCRARR